MARNFKRGRTGLITLVVPELDVPYFSELARAVITQARAHGYTVVVDQTDGEPDRELVMRDSAAAAMFDGVILSPLALTHADLAQRGGDRPWESGETAQLRTRSFRDAHGPRPGGGRVAGGHHAALPPRQRRRGDGGPAGAPAGSARRGVLLQRPGRARCHPHPADQRGADPRGHREGSVDPSPG